MIPRTLRALKKSIQKWEGIAMGIGADHGWKNCALCRKFNNHDKTPKHKACEGCPVYKATGQSGCNGTPFELWGNLDSSDLSQTDDGGVKVFSAHSIDIAKAEVMFLKSLLPRKKK